ncbi:MAG: hypothetical protein GXO25_00610 [Euryarchaeota archaeon]|nr:hypothetical protein [Euryarchaeota archaeon]
MSYVGKKVFVIPEFTTGEIKDEKDGKFLVKVRKKEEWFDADELRLWSEKIEEACGNNRKCWAICGKRIE